MMDFIWYIDSQAIVDKCTELDISLDRSGDMIETTQLVDNQYEYRAMQEYDISFTTSRRGHSCLTPESIRTSYPNSVIEKVNIIKEEK